MSPLRERQRRPRSLPMAAITSVRPYQWMKNLLVLVPLAAAHRMDDLPRLAAAGRAFLAFSLCASSVYLLNDVKDAPADRLHPHKRNRPIASGELPAGLAVALALLLLSGAFTVVWPLRGSARGILALYFLLNVAYTLSLKSIVLLDALLLATGYALRVVIGGVAVSIQPSARLLAFCVFLFFSLALIKRYAELRLISLQQGSTAHARGYLAEDREVVLALGTASGGLAVLVLALYMTVGDVEQNYSRAQLIWLTCVLLLYWVSHMWLMAHRGRMTDDPLVFALKDPLSLLLIALMGVSAWLAV